MTYSKWQMRQYLFQNGYTEESLRGKKVAEIKVLFDVALEKNGVPDPEIKVQPDYLSPEWPEYVLSQFAQNELIDDAPNVHGLRRVAQLLLGQIICTKIVHLNAPVDPTTYGRASCIYEVQIKTKTKPGEVPSIIIFQDVGGAYPGNTDQEYAKYPEAIAATRAEARCLRKALRLQGPASEEVCITPTTENISTEPMSTKINGAQIAMIKSRSTEYKISISKLIQNVIGEEKPLESLSREEAQQVCQRIVEFQTKRTDISEDLKETV
jgi:hypothetical protein